MHKINHLSDCDSLQCDLNNLSTWSNFWNLHYNLDKYTSNPAPILQDYHIDNYQLACKISHRDLGLTLSAKLCWKEHYDNNMLGRAYRTLGLLLRTFKSVSCILAKRVLYISLVRSQFQYCSPARRPHLIKDIISLEKLQRATKMGRVYDYVISTKSDE